MNTTHILFPSNLFHDVERTYQQLLAPLYGAGEVRQFVYLLAEAYLGWTVTDCLLHRREPINQSDLLRFHWALVDLQRQRPIQHIIGSTLFCGCRIAVGPQVLIPRPETEEIVQRTLRALQPQAATRNPESPLRFLDLCTGSGCIAIALKKALPAAQVTAVDYSDEALRTARKNAADNQADITFLHADVLHAMELSDKLKAAVITTSAAAPQAVPCRNVAASVAASENPPAYSLIISNPPYVLERERRALPRNVRDYEPALALFVPDEDALCFYRAIAAFAVRHLAPQGLLMLEINEAQADQTLAVVRQAGFSATLHLDFNDKPRSIEARLLAAPRF